MIKIKITDQQFQKNYHLFFIIITIILVVLSLITPVNARISFPAARPITPPTTPPVTPPTTPPVLENGSFEIDNDNNNLPDRWTAKNLDINDILDTTIVYDGIRSFKFSPATGGQEKLFQILNYNGQADEEIRLEVYNQSDSNVATGQTGVILYVTYQDGRKETTSGVFPYDAHSWLKKTLIIVTDGAYNKIKVQFYNTNTTTNSRVDGANITIVPNAGERNINETKNELTPKELERLN